MTIASTDAGAGVLVAHFDEALEQLRLALLADPVAYNTQVLEAALDVMRAPGGLDELYVRVPAMEAKGVFANSDWDKPAILRPALAVRTLRQGAPAYTTIEALSEIRLLAAAMGDYRHPGN